MTDPVHSAGHLAYAKSAQLYIQQMDDLSEKNSADQLKQFTTSGYFTICRSEHFWSGNFTDQTIEQELMRLLKTSGGITHGRGITDSSLMKWVNACHTLFQSVMRLKNLLAFMPQHLTSTRTFVPAMLPEILEIVKYFRTGHAIIPHLRIVIVILSYL